MSASYTWSAEKCEYHGCENLKWRGMYCEEHWEKRYPDEYEMIKEYERRALAKEIVHENAVEKPPKDYTKYIISEIDSEIIHVLDINGDVQHVIQKIVTTTLPSALEYSGFVLIEKGSRKFTNIEKEHYDGRLYTYIYYKYLNVYAPYYPAIG